MSLNDISWRHGSIIDTIDSLKSTSDILERYHALFTTVPSLTCHSVNIPSQGLSNCSKVSLTVGGRSSPSSTSSSPLGINLYTSRPSCFLTVVSACSRSDVMVIG